MHPQNQMPDGLKSSTIGEKVVIGEVLTRELERGIIEGDTKQIDRQMETI